MFDVNVWELMMIGVVALVVVGPERLPGLARTAGRWLAKTRRFMNTVKAEIDREIKTEELRRIIEEQSHIPELHSLIEETKQDLVETQAVLRSSLDPYSPDPSPVPTLSAVPQTAPVASSDPISSSDQAKPNEVHAPQ